jgi:hypothetical protein
MYGFHLGGSEDGWALEGIGKYGSLEAQHLPWLTDEQREEFDDLDFSEVVNLMETRLLAHLVGFNNTHEPDTAFHERKMLAQHRLGVKFESHGYEYGSIALVIHDSVFDADWSAPTEIDPTKLQAVVDSRLANERLQLALEVLAIQPLQARPAWLLTAEYS